MKKSMEKTSPSAKKGPVFTPPKRSDTHGLDKEKRPKPGVDGGSGR